MKKRALLLGMMLTLAVTSVGCGKKEADANITEPIYEESSEEAVVGDVVDNEEEEDLPDGKVRNELTGELIDESLANQRPIAVMVDNESIALSIILRSTELISLGSIIRLSIKSCI